jgi:hypothetical protein
VGNKPRKNGEQRRRQLNGHVEFNIIQSHPSFILFS